MAERQKLVYISVEDKQSEKLGKQRPFSYTQILLQNTLQVMGCKPRHAFKISKHVFEILRKNILLSLKLSKNLSDLEAKCDAGRCVHKLKQIGEEREPHLYRKLSTYQNKQATITIHREQFLDVVCDALTAYRYVGPTQRADLTLACRIQERKVSLTILLCGTSGCGKSTLSTLLASRLGFTTVVSTDSIRHVMRSFVNERRNPLLWCSTYDAGEYLDPVAVSEAKANRKARKMASIPGHDTMESPFDISQEENGYDECLQHHFHESSKPKVRPEYKYLSPCEGNISCEDQKIISSRIMAVQGYKSQSEIVIDSVDRLITTWEQNHESVIVEGVHLSLRSVVKLMKKHPSILPFMICIENQEKHLERFAVRAKYMTLDPSKNKYVKYIQNIRVIQDYLVKRADKYLIPKINNTNVDRSVAAIHATILSCLRRKYRGEPFYDQTSDTVKMVNEEYRKYSANSLSSKGMFQLLQRRGSSRQFMPLVNTEGLVDPNRLIYGSKSQALDIENVDGVHECMIDPSAMDLLSLQDGNVGVSFLSMDREYRRQSITVDELSSEEDIADDNINRSHASGSSSPKLGDGSLVNEELMDECSVSSDEELEESNLADSEEELGNIDGHLEEDGGSVDDQSCGSDENAEDFGTTIDDDSDRHCSDNSFSTFSRGQRHLKMLLAKMVNIFYS